MSADEDLRAAQLLAVGSVLAGDDKGEGRDHPRFTPTLQLARALMAQRAHAEGKMRGQAERIAALEGEATRLRELVLGMRHIYLEMRGLTADVCRQLHKIREVAQSAPSMDSASVLIIVDPPTPSLERVSPVIREIFDRAMAKHETEIEAVAAEVEALAADEARKKGEQTQ